MIDVSMISLKKRLEREHALVPLVAEIWGVDQGEDGAATISTLIKQMQDAHAARSVWERLSADERLCLFHLFGSGNPEKGMKQASLQKKTRLICARVEAAVDHLRSKWHLIEIAPMRSGAKTGSEVVPGIFPYREGFSCLWQTGQEIFRSYRDRSTFTLAHLLEDLSPPQLQALAGLCHVPMHFGSYPYAHYSYNSSTSPFKELQERVYQALTHPLMPASLLRDLPTPAQEVFLWLCEQGGRVQMAEVRSHFAARSGSAFLALLSALESRALAFDAFSSDAMRYLFIPADLLEIVQREAVLRAEEERRYAWHPRSCREVQDGQPIVLYDLATVIGMSLHIEIAPTKEGKLPKRPRDKIRPLLHGRARIAPAQDDLYVDQLFSAAQKMGLLDCAIPAEEEKRRYLRGPKLDWWSRLRLRDQAHVFLDWWRESSSWVDGSLDGSRLTSSSASHQRLLDQLKQCEPCCWYSIDALLYKIWRQTPLSLSDQFTSMPPRLTLEKWKEGEGKSYMGPLTSLLVELGTISLGSSQEPGVSPEDLFCITPFGAAVLSEAQPDAGVQTGKPTLIVQPNYELLIMAFEPRLIYKLLFVAQIVRIGIVSTFRLTQPALLTGLSNGVKLENLLADLSSTQLPQNVAYTIKDWAKAHREFRLTEVTMIETPENETEESLRRLLGNLPIELRHVAPGIFLILSTGASFGDLRKRLRQASIVVQGEPSRISRRS